jgi:uncharacterized membrane protein YoaT (DUF817 family)
LWRVSWGEGGREARGLRKLTSWSVLVIVSLMTVVQLKHAKGARAGGGAPERLEATTVVP